jgi:hypothetical protein
MTLALARVARVPWWRRLLAWWRTRRRLFGVCDHCGVPDTLHPHHALCHRAIVPWSRDVPMPRPPRDVVDAEVPLAARLCARRVSR